MTKKAKDRIERVKKALEKQKIRSIKDLESYKLSVCHPCSAGIDIGSREIYVGINPEIATELGIPIVHTFSTYTSGLKEWNIYSFPAAIFSLSSLSGLAFLNV